MSVAALGVAYTGRHASDAEGTRAYEPIKHAWDPKRPFEDPADGCPGGWYRSPFAASVLRYTRFRAEGGNRVQNHLLDRVEDPLIHEAVLYFEREHERVYALQGELRLAKMKREQAKR